MFDADTVALISSAPPLPGLNLADLPQQLTDAYARLVAARIRIRELESVRSLPDDIAKLLKETNRLAFSQEALVSALGERENRAAAAFVAGAAHHVALLADKIRKTEPRPSRLSFDSISPEVSATILFLIAESSADAAEMAKAIVIEGSEPIEAALLSAIVHLANGRLRKVLGIALPDATQILVGDRYDRAVSALYLMLLRGVRLMAANMLGGDSENPFSDQGDPTELFERVKALCIESLDGMGEGVGALPYSVYPGPRHLASLLSSASRDLAASALVNTPPPSGIDGDQWSGLLKKVAERRPYLWRNHRQAIASGYLEPGVSAAVSFPTGAGKSTLAELKIATALLTGGKAVFLAPTLALVDQTASALKMTFPDSEVLRERTDELVLDVEGDTLPAISVMTPERCLAMLSFNREIFAGVRLLVFDECHLLHPRGTEASRRAIDAMLSVLNFVAVAPKADLLFLSAMMMNTQEMAGWMGQLTGRECLSLTLTWKPTRQVRGCVVYGDEEIKALNLRLRQTRAKVSNKDAPAELKRGLKISPFGFFCLHQTWQSTARKDYALLPLLEEQVTLSTGSTKNRDWYLTPNGNQVAAAIAQATARQGLKTLVFTQTIPLANSASNTLSKELGQPECLLTDDERDLYLTAADELGGVQHLYLQVDHELRLVSSSACHHGLLLPSERNLHESLFRRDDGINVLVATSTLAQGMNLPSEVVIIGGDSRFDPKADRMEKLDAHELLNAAGRAGRAGNGSYGFVLIVPSKVVNFDDKASRIHSHWADLQAIFAQSDQCLSIDDPLTQLLDQIHDEAASNSDMAMYLLRRLPVSGPSDAGDDAPARALLGRSFAAFRARQQGNAQWIQSRIDAAIALRRADPNTPSVLTWADRLAASAGIPVAIIRELGQPLSGSVNQNATTRDWYLWLAGWFTQRPQLIPQLIRKESLEGIFGTAYKKLEDDEARGTYAVGRIFALLDRWMAGDTFAQMERVFGTKETQLGKCEAAREFVLRLLPEISYIFSLPAQIFRAITIENGHKPDVPLVLDLLGSCVRQGFDEADKLVLRQYLGGRLARRAVHRKFVDIAPVLPPASTGEDFGRALRRVAQAVEISAFL
ncbi:DEAD/DEAH box helicase [Burkholderia pseudomallei]|uniref:DEAD/DEAH box helicase n=1 Tax=Burkholderia pseudomallei TaxID=28450 RepID=UPI001AD61686|nr:DEAD/DEAH box helicase [Burkholderia pseudomallei]MBO7804385.1 DEAD/DEAH box helicase [Burkholderia pseudomallei]